MQGHLEQSEGISSGDVVMGCLAGILALAIFLMDKTPTNIAFVLAAMALLVIRPILRLPWVRAARKPGAQKKRAAAALLVSFTAIAGFGYWQLPPPTTRALSPRQMYSLRELLQSDTGKIEIFYIANDDEAYALASQLILVFRQAGWDIRDWAPPALIGGGDPVGEIDIGYGPQSGARHQLVEKSLKEVGLNCESKFEPPERLLPKQPDAIVITVGHFKPKH